MSFMLRWAWKKYITSGPVFLHLIWFHLQAVKIFIPIKHFLFFFGGGGGGGGWYLIPYTYWSDKDIHSDVEFSSPYKVGIFYVSLYHIGFWYFPVRVCKGLVLSLKLKKILVKCHIFLNYNVHVILIFISVSPRMQQYCRRVIKVVFWTHKFAVGLTDMGNSKSQDP